ncbi:portal protein, partial [Rhizobium sp. Pop5]
PVLENIYGAQLEPTIDRTYQILNRRRELPPPPRELQNQELKIEYISILAQAQKAVATGSIERGFAFLGQVSAVKPEVLDKVDADEAVDLYFDYLGVPPSVVVPDDEVAQLRDARAQKQQMAENAEMAAKMAPAAKSGADAAAVLASAGENPNGAALLQQLGLG